MNSHQARQAERPKFWRKFNIKVYLRKIVWRRGINESWDISVAGFCENVNEYLSLTTDFFYQISNHHTFREYPLQ
jgi:hypothetical protein